MTTKILLRIVVKSLNASNQFKSNTFQLNQLSKLVNAVKLNIIIYLFFHIVLQNIELLISTFTFSHVQAIYKTVTTNNKLKISICMSFPFKFIKYSLGNKNRSMIK